jgi:hypothetical protein
MNQEKISKFESTSVFVQKNCVTVLITNDWCYSEKLLRTLTFSELKKVSLIFGVNVCLANTLCLFGNVTNDLLGNI